MVHDCSLAQMVVTVVMVIGVHGAAGGGIIGGGGLGGDGCAGGIGGEAGGEGMSETISYSSKRLAGGTMFLTTERRTMLALVAAHESDQLVGSRPGTSLAVVSV